ncbi:hypothetical protein DPMN_070393 [Dreissena polymorpha]|uniref:Uncharacterized protein n=1 Tax=Dreissena polymorpha TaxID=45954 RepID=A0A9D4BVL6_DREPO|nr:hypothetical protein DPMN_070393 [Dreissena polymorpha]
MNPFPLEKSELAMSKQHKPEQPANYSHTVPVKNEPFPARKSELAMSKQHKPEQPASYSGKNEPFSARKK